MKGAACDSEERKRVIEREEREVKNKRKKKVVRVTNIGLNEPTSQWAEGEAFQQSYRNLLLRDQFYEHCLLKKKNAIKLPI